MRCELIPLRAEDAGTGLVRHGVTAIRYDASHITIDQGHTVTWKVLNPEQPMELIVTEEQP